MIDYQDILKKEVEHHVNLTIVDSPDHFLAKANGFENYINKSYIAGNDEIELGYYEDKELEEISFWHELGHILSPPTDGRLSIEAQAWETGLELASKYDRGFSNTSFMFAMKSFRSYIKRAE